MRISIGTFNSMICNGVNTISNILSELCLATVSFKGWNRSFIELCWLKVCSNHSAKELIRLGAYRIWLEVGPVADRSKLLCKF